MTGRNSCLDCVRKHIAQASILIDESCLGYPHHKWYAVGHLAEAESESCNEHPLLAQEIREARLAVMNNEKIPSFDSLIIKICKLDGENITYHPGNSKKF